MEFHDNTAHNLRDRTKMGHHGRPLIWVCNQKLTFLFLSLNITCRNSKEHLIEPVLLSIQKKCTKMGKKIFEFFTLKMFAYLDLCMGNLFSYILLKFNLRKRKNYNWAYLQANHMSRSGQFNFRKKNYE